MRHVIPEQLQPALQLHRSVRLFVETLAVPQCPQRQLPHVGHRERGETLHGRVQLRKHFAPRLRGFDRVHILDARLIEPALLENLRQRRAHRLVKSPFEQRSAQQHDRIKRLRKRRIVCLGTRHRHRRRQVSRVQIIQRFEQFRRRAAEPRQHVRTTHQRRHRRKRRITHHQSGQRRKQRVQRAVATRPPLRVERRHARARQSVFKRGQHFGIGHAHAEPPARRRVSTGA